MRNKALELRERLVNYKVMGDEVIEKTKGKLPKDIASRILLRQIQSGSRLAGLFFGDPVEEKENHEQDR